MKQKIRKGDTVEIIAGRSEDKKKRGEVIRVIPAESRVVVQGVNIRSVSNVMLVCPKCNAATRVGFSRKDGKVTRICKKCHAEIDA